MQTGFGCTSLNRSRESSSFFIIHSSLQAQRSDYFNNTDVIYKQELYEYNYDNMLTRYVKHRPELKDNKIEMVTETELNLEYDVNGMRVIKQCYPNTTDSTIYIYEGGEVVLEMDYDQLPKKKHLFTYAGGKKVSRTSFNDDGTIDLTSRKYFHQNFLGSIAMITDINGNIEEHNKYEPFGDVIWSRSYVDTDNNYKFTGKERDKESGLDYFNARYLDHKLGRFMKPDVVQGNIQNPQSLNRFVYCMNNPVKYIDPSGMVPRKHLNKQGGQVDNPFFASKKWWTEYIKEKFDKQITALHLKIQQIKDEYKNWKAGGDNASVQKRVDSLFADAVSILESLIPEVSGHVWVSTPYEIKGKTDTGVRKGNHYEITIGVMSNSVNKIISTMIHEGTEASKRIATGRLDARHDLMPHNYAILMEYKYRYISKYNNKDEMMERYVVSPLQAPRLFNGAMEKASMTEKQDYMNDFFSISENYLEEIEQFNTRVRKFHKDNMGEK